MYQFPTWRYWVVAIVMIAGIVLAAPNAFRYDNALQISRKDRGAMDSATEEQVIGILRTANIPTNAHYIEEDRLVVRFPSVDEQLKARDSIRAAAPGDYIIALTRESRAPSWMRAIGLKPMPLGLDLRGGVQFLYEVDVEGAITQALERLERDIRSELRERRISGTVLVDRNAVKVTLRDAKDLQAATKAITDDTLGLNVTADTSGPTPVLNVTFTEQQIKERQDLAIEQNITTLRNRVDQLGVAEPRVTRRGRNRILVELPGVDDPNEAIRVLGATATLEFRLVDETRDPYEAARTNRAPLGTKLYKFRDGTPILLKRELIVSGDQLTDARTGFGDQGPEVNVKLDDRGGRAMLATTKENVGRRMAVVYKERKRLTEGEVCRGIRDGEWCTEEEVVTAPTIQGVFSSAFRITGFGAAEAREIALLLRAGSLATSNFLVEQRTVGPSLGEDNIRNGFRAMVIGSLLTFAFLILYYRGFGAIACVVLLANVVLLVAAMSGLGATLSLPGIAGIVLTVGMAADANILIYERVREELRLGNSPQAAIHAGFDKAFSAILDANITTLIAGIVLFAFGTGPIRGFAVTLTIGIATSLFTAVLGSRALIQLIWGRRRKLAELPV
ncbi:MAG TPA: protein translocase subunit SecD [Steroidobacteraceae bacterium]